MTNAQKKAARDASKILGWLDKQMAELCDDPMTAAMGAPVDEFYNLWEGQYRTKLCNCLDNPNNPQRIREILIDELQRFEA